MGADIRALPRASIDVAILWHVYHEIENPYSIRRATALLRNSGPATSTVPTDGTSSCSLSLTGAKPRGGPRSSEPTRPSRFPHCTRPWSGGTWPMPSGSRPTTCWSGPLRVSSLGHAGGPATPRWSATEASTIRPPLGTGLGGGSPRARITSENSSLGWASSSPRPPGRTGPSSISTTSGDGGAVDQGGQRSHSLDAPLLPPVPGQRGAVTPRGHRLQPRQSPAAARLAARHPELVADQPPAAAVQDRWSRGPACAVIHPAGCPEALAITTVWCTLRTLPRDSMNT